MTPNTQTSHTTSPQIDALDTLLERERTALLAGDFATLTELLPDKEALIEALNAKPTEDLDGVQTLGSKVARNQVLLESAMSGMREVVDRMATLRRMRVGLDTYGSDGNRHHIEVQAEHSVERRA